MQHVVCSHGREMKNLGKKKMHCVAMHTNICKHVLVTTTADNTQITHVNVVKGRPFIWSAACLLLPFFSLYA